MRLFFFLLTAWPASRDFHRSRKISSDCILHKGSQGGHDGLVRFVLKSDSFQINLVLGHLAVTLFPWHIGLNFLCFILLA